MKQAGDKKFYTAHELAEGVTYIFSVRAKTDVGWGEASVGNITVGPQPGSPPTAERPTVILGDTTITIKWRNSYSAVETDPITGYIVQMREKDGEKRQMLVMFNMQKTSVEHFVYYN